MAKYFSFSGPKLMHSLFLKKFTAEKTKFSVFLQTHVSPLILILLLDIIFQFIMKVVVFKIWHNLASNFTTNWNPLSYSAEKYLQYVLTVIIL